MKFLVFDASTLISLSLGGIIDTLEKLKTKNIEFIITPDVRRETVDRALSIKKYKLDATRINSLIERKILKISSEFIEDQSLQKKTQEIIEKSRRVITWGRENINLIHTGEASCLAFSELINADCLIALDERNTRLLTEFPEELKRIMERKLGYNLTLNKKNSDYFKNFRFIRSSEIVFLSLQKGFFKLKKNKENLDALLYNLKFHGTAISSKEIEEMKKIFIEKN